MRRLLAVVACVAAAATLTSACGSAQAYAAKVNGETLPVDALDDELAEVLRNKQYVAAREASGERLRGKGKGTFDTAFVAEILTQQVLYELVRQQLETRKLRISDYDRSQAKEVLLAQIGDRSLFDAFSDDYQRLLVERNAQVTALQASVGDVDLSERAVREYYEENAAEQFPSTCVRHILVDTREQADQIRAQILGGADFARIAASSSKDTGSARNGGDLDCFNPEQSAGLVEEFADAMERLEVGQLSEPVQTRFGFHLIEVTARRPIPLGQVTPQVRAALLRPSQEAFVEMVGEMIGDAKVVVNPRFGRFVKEGANGQVVPPEAPAVGTTTTAQPFGLPGGGGPPGINDPDAGAPGAQTPPPGSRQPQSP